jgi:hypothetical protein
MSGHIAGQTRALPFTGLTSGPFALLGLLLTAVGALLALARPSHENA